MYPRIIIPHQAGYEKLCSVIAAQRVTKRGYSAAYEPKPYGIRSKAVFMTAEGRSIRKLERKGAFYMELQLEKRVRDNDKARAGFFALADDVFGLNFEEWYRNGYWGDSYTPYSLLDNGLVVANASINTIRVRFHNVSKLYIQIGTVMTARPYRNRGLARMLIEEIIGDWKERCDSIYLYANNTVLDFYPKFGFVSEKEYQYGKGIVPRQAGVRKLNMESSTDIALLEDYYGKSNPFSELPMIGNFGLVMFYCSSFLRDCVYYLEEFDAVVIAAFDGSVMTCFDIYCGEGKDFDTVLAKTARQDTDTVTFGFTPKYKTGCAASPADGDDALFVLSGTENIFACKEIMLPLLSHA